MNYSANFTSQMEHSTPPLISTIIPAHNAAAFIDRALNSALAQNIPHCEIIVVDDGSRDNTAEIVTRYADKGVRLIRHSRCRGVAEARNTGILASQGEYIAFLDADDEWLPQKLTRQLDVIASNPGMKFISCRATLIDEKGRDHGDIYRGAKPATGAQAWRTLLTYPCVATPSVLVRRSALADAGLFNKWLPVAEDQDMWIRLSMLGDIGHVAEPLVRVHSTPNSLSKACFKDQAGYVLPLVAAYVARNAGKMTLAERHKILGERYGRIGQSAYANGEVVFGLTTLARAVTYGYPLLPTLIFIIKASAVMQRVKRVIQNFRN